MYNTAIGANALRNNNAHSNTAVGVNALHDNTNGTYNTANGIDALASNTSGNANTAIGAAALRYNATGIHNTANGAYALFANVSGDYNTANGANSLRYNTTGTANTASGTLALYNNTTGNNNTAIGMNAMRENNTGNDNTAIGKDALFYNSTGNGNTAIGYQAGIGTNGITLNECTFVGSNSTLLTSRTNVTMIGYGITDNECTGDNQILLGNTSITQIRAAVSSITTYSDKRYKTNILEDIKGLDFILKLRPVSYNVNPQALYQIWGNTKNRVITATNPSVRFTGLIAQEVHEAMKASNYLHFTGIDIPQNDKQVYTLRYVDFIMPIIKAIQEQQAIIEAQRKKIELLEKEQQLLKSRIQEIESIKSHLLDVLSR